MSNYTKKDLDYYIDLRDVCDVELAEARERTEKLERDRNRFARRAKEVCLHDEQLIVVADTQYDTLGNMAETIYHVCCALCHSEICSKFHNGVGAPTVREFPKYYNI